MKSAILITSYFPPIYYFFIIKQYDQIYIDLTEEYKRQTLRNRCYILTANGLLALTVPVKHPINNFTKDIMIDYSKNWINNHINSIKSAYGKSPYFYHLKDLIFPTLLKKYKFLVDLNNEIIFEISKFLNLETNKIKFLYNKNELNLLKFNVDFRKIFSTKKFFNLPIVHKEYLQVFSDKFGFIPNLSIIDLIFCCGKEAFFYF